MGNYQDEQIQNSALAAEEFEESDAFKETYARKLYRGFKRNPDNSLVFPLVYLVEYDQTRPFEEIPWSVIEADANKIGAVII